MSKRKPKGKEVSFAKAVLFDAEGVEVLGEALDEPTFPQVMDKARKRLEEWQAKEEKAQGPFTGFMLYVQFP